ncbi:MAG TPA: asparagine synthase-related protein, partial [Blastocatellia bacterium]|nr:asparagine synthase-related protein [Blastocatellia bacterium]
MHLSQDWLKGSDAVRREGFIRVGIEKEGSKKVIVSTAVAMSGGVDSSVAAAILKNQGHEVVGFTMQLWNQRRRLGPDAEPQPSRCCSLDDVYDARRVAEQMGFPFYVINMEDEFERGVVRPFVEAYLQGRTPIPCVACNSRL